MSKQRVFSWEFKESVAQRMLNGESVSALHHELQIKRSVLYRWRDAYRKEGVAGLQRVKGRPPGVPNPPRPAGDAGAAAARRIAELERKIGQQALDLDFFRRAFKRVNELRRKPAEPGATASTEKSGK
jgi:transposase-like protein